MARLPTREPAAAPSRAPLRTLIPRYSRFFMRRFHPAAPRFPRAGFTLIEVLVVVVMIAILATLVAPNVFRHVGGAKRSTAKSQVEMIGAALDAFRLDVGRYPTAAEGLDALNAAPAGGAASGWNGPYLKKKVPLDPWRRRYVFRSPGEVDPAGYDLLSLGADGQPGGQGENADVVSWE